MSATATQESWDPYFGVCPDCWHTDGYLNVGRHHVFVCHEHRTCWYAGSNLFSSWREQDPADWLGNEATLAGYIEVEPA